MGREECHDRRRRRRRLGLLRRRPHGSFPSPVVGLDRPAPRPAPRPKPAYTTARACLPGGPPPTTSLAAIRFPLPPGPVSTPTGFGERGRRPHAVTCSSRQRARRLNRSADLRGGRAESRADPGPAGPATARGPSVKVLIALVMECTAGPALGQSSALLGTEALVLGALALVVGSTLHPQSGVKLRYRMTQLAIAVLSTALPIGRHRRRDRRRRPVGMHRHRGDPRPGDRYPGPEPHDHGGASRTARDAGFVDFDLARYRLIAGAEALVQPRPTSRSARYRGQPSSSTSGGRS